MIVVGRRNLRDRHCTDLHATDTDQPRDAVHGQCVPSLGHGCDLVQNFRAPRSQKARRNCGGQLDSHAVKVNVLDRPFAVPAKEGKRSEAMKGERPVGRFIGLRARGHTDVREDDIRVGMNATQRRRRDHRGANCSQIRVAAPEQEANDCPRLEGQ